MRDLLACAAFVVDTAPRLGSVAALQHAVHMVLLDGLGVGAGMPPQVQAHCSRQQLLTVLTKHQAKDCTASVVDTAPRLGSTAALQHTVQVVLLNGLEVGACMPPQVRGFPSRHPD